MGKLFGKCLNRAPEPQIRLNVELCGPGVENVLFTCLLSQRGDDEEVADDAREGETHLDEHQGHALRRGLHRSSSAVRSEQISVGCKWKEAAATLL